MSRHTNSEILIWVALRCSITEGSITCQDSLEHRNMFEKNLILKWLRLFNIFVFWKQFSSAFIFINKYTLNTMNKINQKVQTTGKLLNILCKRDSNRLIRYKEEEWPGKRRPSFASNIRIKKQSETPLKLTERDNRHSNGLWRRSSQKMLIKTNQITSSARSLSLIPKKDCLNTVKQLQLHKFDTESDRTSSLHNQIIKSHISKKTEKDELNDYVIDYLAFNYIGKVIDNPELWSKFVHKKLNF